MKNGRENRNNGNQEKGKKEKETLASSVRSQQGTLNASPKFFWKGFGILQSSHPVMLSGERDREANSFGVEASLPNKHCRRLGIPRCARNDSPRILGHTNSYQPWNALFFLRTKTPIRAEAAVLPHLRLEHTIGNSLGCIFDAGASRQQL